jgi:hypothetical protein
MPTHLKPGETFTGVKVMKKKIQPHPLFKLHTADEVAECWEGVPEALYLKLWNVIVPKQKEIPNREDNGPADVIGIGNLAAHWKLLTDDEQKLLNGLAEKKQAEFDEWFNKRS